MSDVKDFFNSKNTVYEISQEDLNQKDNYLEAIYAFARTTYKSIYVIDYKEKGFEYVSENPLFLCGHSAKEVKEMGYEFYFKHVPDSDLELLLKINKAGFEFYESIPLEERKYATISYDFHLKNNEGKTILVNQKLTPIFLTKEGKVWKCVCIISLSNEKYSGNIRIYNTKTNKISEYDLKGDFWRTSNNIELNKREKEILQLSIRGYTINEVANKIFLSSDTVKYHRKNLYEKLEVSNMSEAIISATNNRLI